MAHRLFQVDFSQPFGDFPLNYRLSTPKYLIYYSIYPAKRTALPFPFVQKYAILLSKDTKEFYDEGI